MSASGSNTSVSGRNLTTSQLTSRNLTVNTAASLFNARFTGFADFSQVPASQIKGLLTIPSVENAAGTPVGFFRDVAPAGTVNFRTLATSATVDVALTGNSITLTLLGIPTFGNVNASTSLSTATLTTPSNIAITGGQANLVLSGTITSPTVNGLRLGALDIAQLPITRSTGDLIVCSGLASVVLPRGPEGTVLTATTETPQLSWRLPTLTDLEVLGMALPGSIVVCTQAVPTRIYGLVQPAATSSQYLMRTNATPFWAYSAISGPITANASVYGFASLTGVQGVTTQNFYAAKGTTSSVTNISTNVIAGADVNRASPSDAYASSALTRVNVGGLVVSGATVDTSASGVTVSGLAASAFAGATFTLFFFRERSGTSTSGFIASGVRLSYNSALAAIPNGTSQTTVTISVPAASLPASFLPAALIVPFFGRDVFQRRWLPRSATTTNLRIDVNDFANLGAIQLGITVDSGNVVFSVVAPFSNAATTLGQTLPQNATVSYLGAVPTPP